MSKMSELAATLDDLTRVVKAVITCGEDVLRAVAHVREFFSGNENAVPKLQEPVKVAEPVAVTPAPKAYTKEEVRAILADLSQNGFRNEAKALVRKYSDGGSLTDIDPAKYPDLVAEAEALHG